MSTPTSVTPAPEPLLRRLPRSLVAIALALALTVITAIVVLGCMSAVRAAFAPLFEDDSKTPKVALALAILFIIFLPLMLLFVAARKRWLTWTVLAFGWVVVIPVLLWLAWDDPAIRQPVLIEEFSPVFPGAEQSYAVLMQYSRLTPSEEAKAYAKVKLAVPGFGTSPQDAAKWVEFVTANRAGLEADWATLAPQRRWLGELAAFDRIGDLMPAEIDPNTMNFQVWRSLTYHVCGFATVQALDGHGDDAMAALIPLLDASRKLQLSSRSLIRSMISEVVERMTMQTAGIVLDHTTVSAATRDRLKAVLANENAPALARRLIMVDYVRFAPVYFAMKLGDSAAPSKGFWSVLRRPLNFLSALFLNPNATMNLYGDHVRELAALAETRELGKFAVRHHGFGEDVLLKPAIKNLGGRLMVNMSVPAFDKLLESHWKTADLRDGLRKRLAATP